MTRPQRKLTADSLRKLPKSKVDQLFKELGPQKVEELKHTWSFWARDNQLEPEDNGWNVWIVNAGRGFGKTRCGVEWVRENVSVVLSVLLL